MDQPICWSLVDVWVTPRTAVKTHVRQAHDLPELLLCFRKQGRYLIMHGRCKQRGSGPQSMTAAAGPGGAGVRRLWTHPGVVQGMQGLPQGVMSWALKGHRESRGSVCLTLGLGTQWDGKRQIILSGVRMWRSPKAQRQGLDSDSSSPSTSILEAWEPGSNWGCVGGVLGVGEQRHY